MENHQPSALLFGSSPSSSPPLSSLMRSTSIFQQFDTNNNNITMSLEHLPEDCIAQILSSTSPHDACRLSLVSTSIHDASESELLWEKFLPPGYRNIVSWAVYPLSFTSKKDLFLKLSDPLLIDGGKKICFIERSRNKICYVLGARELSISWGNDPHYWCWKSFLPSRFPEVVELIMVTWLNIQGKMNTKLLSQDTTYAAYLVIKLTGRAYGLDTLASEVSVEVGNDFKSSGSSSLKRRPLGTTKPCIIIPSQETEDADDGASTSEEKFLHDRKDGWLEIELGQFYNDGCEKEVTMSFKEVNGVYLKGGLILEGIEIRPK